MTIKNELLRHNRHSIARCIASYLALCNTRCPENQNKFL